MITLLTPPPAPIALQKYPPSTKLLSQAPLSQNPTKSDSTRQGCVSIGNGTSHILMWLIVSNNM